MTCSISLTDVSKTYRRGQQRVDVLRSVDLQVGSGEFLALMGPSGSGKTTLLNLIGGLDTPTSGTIKVNEQRIDQLTRRQLAAWRSQSVGFIFQFYNLMPTLTALQNVALPLLLSPSAKAQRNRRAKIALQLVGLAERLSHRPTELSGGQQQRVAIARAIVADPAFLICDEPTGDLDRESAAGVMDLLQRLNREHGKTIVMVTHDPKAAGYATRVVHLDKGELLEPTGVGAGVG